MNETKEKARADVLSRPNAMSGRYEKGEFELGHWYKDFQIEGPNVLTARADLADELIAQAQSEGKNVDDPMVLKNIAQQVNSKVRQKIWRNRILALAVVALLVFVLATLIF